MGNKKAMAFFTADNKMGSELLKRIKFTYTNFISIYDKNSYCQQG